MDTQIIINEKDIQLNGLRWAGTPSRDLLDVIKGPVKGKWAVKTVREEVEFELKAENPIGRQGSIMLWLQTDRPYQGGIGVEDTEQRILSVKGLFSLTISNHSQGVHLWWKWDEGVQGVDSLKMLLPSLPGPQWVHMLFCWDAGAGILQGYINGTPIRLPGTRVTPWKMGTSGQISIYVGRFAVGDAAISDRVYEAEAVGQLVPNLYKGALDTLLGAKEEGMLSIENRKGPVIYSASLASEKNAENWVLEGPGKIGFNKGWMEMESICPDGPEGNIVYWCNEEVPEDFIAEWEMQIISEYGLCIIFFCAAGKGGEDIFDTKLQPRNGVFSQYTMGDIACYHISYYAQNPHLPGRPTSNLRKDPGAYLIANGPVGIKPGSEDVHKVMLVKTGSEIQLSVNGRRVIHFYDDGVTYGPVLGKGKLGLRQMQWTRARYRNLKVYSICD